MAGKMRRIGSLFMITLLSICFSVIGTGTVSASPTAVDPAAASSHHQVQLSATQQTYWTSARMQSARSADVLASTGKLVQKSAHATASGSSKPVAPIGAAQAKPAAHSAVITPDAYTLPNSSYSSYPYSTVGKVFFTDAQTGYNYVCSGTAINSANKSVVDTAGHCLAVGGSGNHWYSNWIFCPQYYYGSTPYGCWSAKTLTVSNGWLYSNSLEDDFGAVTVWPNAYGNLVNVVGGAGWAYGQGAVQYYYAFGYPAAYPFNGAYIAYCLGSGTGYGYDDGTVVSIYCDLNGGSDGGPWFISINGTYGYVNGHNDFNSDGYHVYSPYYDIDWYNVFNAAQYM